MVWEVTCPYYVIDYTISPWDLYYIPACFIFSLWLATYVTHKCHS